MKKNLIYNKDSILFINNLLKRKSFKGIVVVTAQNLVYGGPWKVLNDAIYHLAKYKKDYLIIVIIYRRLEKEYKNVINLI